VASFAAIFTKSARDSAFIFPITLPRCALSKTGIEKSQIPSRNHAIPQMAVQKPLHLIRCLRKRWRDGTACRLSSSRQFSWSRERTPRLGNPNIGFAAGFRRTDRSSS
jgi:hypothetical protein